MNSAASKAMLRCALVTPTKTISSLGYMAPIRWIGEIRCREQRERASAMFEYRFNGNGELAGHNLGNLMLKA